MAVKLGINPGIPDLPQGLSDPDFLLVSPLYRAFGAISSQVSYATGQFVIPAAELQEANRFDGILEGSKIFPLGTATMPYGTLVNLFQSSGVLAARLATSAAGTPRPAHGIVVQPGGLANGTRGAVLISPGLLPNITGAAEGVIYYLGAAGVPTATKPSAVGTIVQSIGFGLGTNNLWFDRSTLVLQN